MDSLSSVSGLQTRKMVLLAAALFLICRLPSASVLIGQDAVMAKPASISPLVSASQAPLALCVNIRVMTPSGFSVRRHSAKMDAMRSW